MRDLTFKLFLASQHPDDSLYMSVTSRAANGLRLSIDVGRQFSATIVTVVASSRNIRMKHKALTREPTATYPKVVAQISCPVPPKILH